MISINSSAILKSTLSLKIISRIHTELTQHASAFCAIGYFLVHRTLFLTDTRTIDPPSPRLLALHSAIAHILHLSAAAHHIDKILEDLDQRDIMADGSTELGYLAKLRVHGWWNGQIRAC